MPDGKWTWTRICQTGNNRKVKELKWKKSHWVLLLIKVTLTWKHLHAFGYDGFYSFAFAAFPRGLTEISALSSFFHLRFVDLSHNYLTDLNPLATLTQLLWLKVNNSLYSGLKALWMLSFTVYPHCALSWHWKISLSLQVDNNCLSCLRMQPLAQFPYLQWLSLVLNRITDLHGLIGPALECVNLNGWLTPLYPRVNSISLMQYPCPIIKIQFSLHGFI